MLSLICEETSAWLHAALSSSLTHKFKVKSINKRPIVTVAVPKWLIPQTSCRHHRKRWEKWRLSTLETVLRGNSWLERWGGWFCWGCGAAVSDQWCYLGNPGRHRDRNQVRSFCTPKSLPQFVRHLVPAPLKKGGSLSGTLEPSKISRGTSEMENQLLPESTTQFHVSVCILSLICFNW